VPARAGYDASGPSADVQARMGGGRAGGNRRGLGGGAMDAMASMPATPELLAAVEKLPPATDVPDVDLAAATAADDDFTLGKLVRPLVRPLLLAFLLVAADAAATLALPALIRGGIDNGVEKQAIDAVWTVSLVALVVVILDAFVNRSQIRLTARTGERFLYTLRLKTFAHLQRLGLDYYEREMSGRIMTRMTTDVDAFSTFLQTGLVLLAGLSP
jgi:ATP-binding cassette subfamily B protein